MAKRAKRLEKGIETLKSEIERHFDKIEKDISEGNFDRGMYHIKEIDKSLLKALELKLEVVGLKDNSILEFRKRLDELRERVKF